MEEARPGAQSSCSRTIGKTSYNTCRLKVLMKDFAYISHDGNLSTEPVEIFRQWMTKHEYDPEHGKETPTRLAPTPPAPAASAPGSAPASASGTPPPQ